MQLADRNDFANRSAVTALWLVSLSQRLIYPLGIFILGLAYRATFLNQGFNATDEGWLQALGARIVSGQLPYRDFYYTLPPVSIYKEAALIKVLHDSYGILASRWVLAIEVSLCSVIAFLILRRYAAPFLALLVTLPTIFFSVILYYFSSYTYDASFLVLLSSLLLIYSDGRRKVLLPLAGALTGLAVLTKPTYVGFALLVIVIGIAKLILDGNGFAIVWNRTWAAKVWPAFFLGFTLVCSTVLAFFIVGKALQPFILDSFVLVTRSNPRPLAFMLWLDMPIVFIKYGVIAVMALFLAVVRLPRITDAVRLGLVGIVLTVVVADVILRGQSTAFTKTALCALLVVNLAALLVTVLVNGPWLANHPWAAVMRQRLFPLEIPLLALGMQFLAQYSYAGMGQSYLGCFLSVPVALLFLYRLARDPLPVWWGEIRWLRISPALAALFGLWLVIGSVAATRQWLYRDGNRAQLTAKFQTAKLSGVTSLPSEVNRVDGMVAMVKRYTVPGDPIFVFPDFAALYWLTDRTNPTRVAWYNPDLLVPKLSDEAVGDLERHPPRLVFLETYSQWDFQDRNGPLDYSAEPKWRPIYRYVTAHYKQIDTVGDIRVFVPLGS